jgi:hypothetical protein
MTSEAYHEIGPTSQTSTAPRQPHPAILRIVAELGLRYRPLATADQEDHQAGVLLLARDLDGCDIGKLGQAAEQWARSQKFMPKACDLISLMSQMAGVKKSAQQRCDEWNAQLLTHDHGRRDIHWVVVGTEPKLAHK